MPKGDQPLPDADLVGWVRNHVPSRERAEDVRAIARMIEDDSPEAAQSLEEVVEFLLDLRHKAKGGRRNVYGSRHWNGCNIHGED